MRRQKKADNGAEKAELGPQQTCILTNSYCGFLQGIMGTIMSVT